MTKIENLPLPVAQIGCMQLISLVVLVIMADHADDEFDGDVFIYRGGEVPLHVTHVLIDESVNEIEDGAFSECEDLLTVETHDGLRKIGVGAFYNCTSLRRINLKSAVVIDEYALQNCYSLEAVEFGGRLESIGIFAFSECSIKHLKLPSIITIGTGAFRLCTSLIDVELSERLETIGIQAFWSCDRLQRIAMPIKRDLFPLSAFNQKGSQFMDCEQLATVDLVDGVHKTVSSLHMDSWRSEIISVINRINKVLPNTHYNEKTAVIKRWMEMVVDKMDHYKAEHRSYVKEGMTILELALWKAKLIGDIEEGRAMKANVAAERVRNESRVLCGAEIVIKNVLPHLQLEE